VRRYLAVVLIVLGCLTLTVDVTRLDGVVFSVTSTHGVHISDIVGAASVAVGTALLWRAAGGGR
jgi:hypothetical protein